MKVTDSEISGSGVVGWLPLGGIQRHHCTTALMCHEDSVDCRSAAASIEQDGRGVHEDSDQTLPKVNGLRTPPDGPK